MTERELKCIAQRVATHLETPEDVVVLLEEVWQLRMVLNTVQGMTGDPAILHTINQALGKS